MKVTLLIVPIEGVDDFKLLESFETIPAKYMRIGKDRRFNTFVKTDWKLFMYADEYFSPQLVESIPVLVENEEFDYFSFYKVKKENNKLVYSISPRMFRATVKIRDNMAFPVDFESLKGIPVLNGFILGYD